MKISVIAVLALNVCLSGFAAQGENLLPVEPLRTTFARTETKPVVRFLFRNHSHVPLKDIQLKGSFCSWQVQSQLFSVAPGKSNIALIKLPTVNLTPGKYPLDLRLTAVSGREKHSFRIRNMISIAPLKVDHMPIMKAEFDAASFRKLKDLGFTVGSTHLVSNTILSRRSGTAFEALRKLDDMASEGFDFVEHFHVGHSRFAQKFPRYARNGKFHGGGVNLEVSNPEVVGIIRKEAEKTADLIQDHPGVAGISINSEVRDRSQPSFNPKGYENAAFRKYASFDIPSQVETRWAPHYKLLADFPADMAVPEKYPLFVYYDWFWKTGDGWNPVHSMISDIFKKRFSRPLWTLNEPAVRVPPSWGYGGSVDKISHWTYLNPHPLLAAVNVSQLQAMARGRKDQGVVGQLQVIAYRSAVAPIKMKLKDPPSWVKEKPLAPFVTAAPDMMEIAMWLQIARKMDGISFHGYQSLLPTDGWKLYPHIGYHFTNGETAQVMKKFFHEVIHPLGPVLKRIPERKSEVALLESFASSVFAHRGSWGWTSWIVWAHEMLLWANLAPSVIYEEEILRSGFGSIKVLVMPHCDVLPAKVIEAIRKFQERGGIVAADRYLVPGILPHIQIQPYHLTKDPARDKKILQERGELLRKQLAPYFQPYAESSSPDLLAWVRSSGKADYLFVINDKRTFGDYFGPYRLVQEKRLPLKGVVTLRRSNTKAAYDPQTQKEIAFSVQNGKTILEADLTKKSGQIILLLPEKVGSVALEVPASCRRGGSIAVTGKVYYASGKAVDHLHPVEIRVLDPSGKKTDNSTFGALQNGILDHKILIGVNAKTGKWSVIFRELASGKQIIKNFHVK